MEEVISSCLCMSEYLTSELSIEVLEISLSE
jgi:hypothetical protein